MNEKFKFFQTAYFDTLKEQEKLKVEFLNLAKIAPLFYALAYFFFTKSNTPIIFHGDKIHWYNFILLIQILLLIGFTYFISRGYLFPPKSKLLSSPAQLAKHWSDLEKHAQNYDISDTADKLFMESIVPQYVTAAQANDERNAIQYRRKDLAGRLIIAILISSLVQILILMLG